MGENPMATRIAELVVEASDGTVSGAQLSQDATVLTEIGLTSLSYLRLIDAIENEFGVYIDLEEAAGKLGTVREIADYVAEQGGVYAR
ncbi:acyl carrier protein [Plantactinospora sp. ZYX-F-223]|uniref:acyl carrier protein n=1 Tax=Plantactinospora sp. ZYX-F-223 TaxID=3144103 RepID=UPI0031FC25B4